MESLDDCFCRQKAEMNFTQSMGFDECNFQNSDKKYWAYGVRTKQLLLSFACRCHETGLIPVLLKQAC